MATVATIRVGIDPSDAAKGAKLYEASAKKVVDATKSIDVANAAANKSTDEVVRSLVQLERNYGRANLTVRRFLPGMDQAVEATNRQAIAAKAAAFATRTHAAAITLLTRVGKGLTRAFLVAPFVVLASQAISKLLEVGAAWGRQIVGIKEKTEAQKQAIESLADAFENLASAQERARVAGALGFGGPGPAPMLPVEELRQYAVELEILRRSGQKTVSLDDARTLIPGMEGSPAFSTFARDQAAKLWQGISPDTTAVPIDVLIAELAKAADEAERYQKATAGEDIVRQYKEQTRLLQLSNDEREIALALAREENELKTAGFSEAERAPVLFRIRDQLEQQLQIRREQADAEAALDAATRKRAAAVADELASLRQMLKVQQDIEIARRSAGDAAGIQLSDISAGLSERKAKIGLSEKAIARRDLELQLVELTDSMKDAKTITEEEAAAAIAVNLELYDLVVGLEAADAQARKNAATLQASTDIVAEAIQGSLQQVVNTLALDFENAGNAVRNFVQTLAQAVITDLTKDWVENAASAISGAFTGSTSTSSSGPDDELANGGVFLGGRLQPFASGGVVNSPTLFPMANGGMGLMGEAGPEAIMPLERGPDGKLGVRIVGGGSSTVIVNMAGGGGDAMRKTGRQIGRRVQMEMGR